MKFLAPFIAIVLLFSSGCGPTEPPPLKKAPKNDDKLVAQATTIFGVLPESANNPNNPTTDEKVLLGQTLFFDNQLSMDETQSCNTCHNLATYGVDNSPTSKGDNGGFGDRNSPTVLNAALHSTQFWDGREPDVEAQAGGPILNPVEMAIPSEAFLIERLKIDDNYTLLFTTAYPDQSEPYTYENIRLAIAAFERELLTPSKFDDYLKNDFSSLNEQEKNGMSLFIEEGCTTCHVGPLLGGNMFQKFGKYEDYWVYTKSEKIDKGKFTVTEVETDMYVFKVPSLRNIEMTGPYLHDGSVTDLSEVVKIMGKIQLDKDLTDEQIADIVAFLNTLTGTVPEKYQKAPGASNS
jgi:cytochrome c peroxidase